MHNILFVESGTSSGGSFESLFQHLQVINRKRFRPVVVYLNRNRFIEPIRALKIPVYVLTDFLYSKDVPSFVQRVLSYILSRIDRHRPVLYIVFTRLAHLPLIKALENIVKKERINILHLNDQINRDLFGLFVADRMGIVCISHLRSMDGGNFDWRRANYANRVVSAYIANSKYTKQYWEEKGVNNNKIWLVYNAVPRFNIKPLDIHKVWGINKKTFTIGCVGRLVSWKGQKFLFRTFAEFIKNYPDSLLMIVGDGPMKQDLIKDAHNLRIEKKVIFTGYQEKTKELIAAFNLLVLPSLGEPMGRVLLEAMQVRTPVVASNSGAIPEIIEHEHNGLLVDYGDVRGMVRALERILINEELCSKLVDNGYRIVNERFSIENYSSRIENIYKNVLQNKVH